jgi:hypothetical protein
MNGFGVLLLAAGIMLLALAWSALCDHLARRRMRGAPISDAQFARRDGDQRRPQRAWDAEAARRARRVK